MRGRQRFADLIAQALSTSAVQGWSPLVLADPDFADWPLGERAVVDALHAWSARGRSLRMIAHDFKTLRERHPRFVQWRVTWSHLFEARACGAVPPGELPSALWSPAWTLERIDMAQALLVASTAPGRRVALGERLEHWWRKGSPSFPAVTLGL
jgi:hypothetical protein